MIGRTTQITAGLAYKIDRRLGPISRPMVCKLVSMLSVEQGKLS
jgi:hypothetical protein